MVVAWLAAAGCTRTPPPSAKVAPAPSTSPQEALEPGLEGLRQGREARHFRDGLNLVNAYLAQNEGKVDVHLGETERAFLKDVLGLDAAELEEIDAGSFRPLDAVHLDGCFLFHEAARSLDVGDLSPVDQATAAFGWTMRRVLLHEQHDDAVPPYLVAKRGYGGPRDRALVFLFLLRQLRLEGCVIALPSAKGEAEALWVGVLIPSDKGHDLALFDVRLGLPVRDGDGVATLAAARANPKLIEADWKQAEARFGFELAALAPRMKFLEDALAARERIVLHQDAQALHKSLTAAAGWGGMKIAGWPTGTPPWELARQFFPPSEGGVDKADRLRSFVSQMAPVTPALYKLEEMRLYKDVPEEARLRLQMIVLDLFGKFEQQPREMLLRGEHDAALKRIDRIHGVLDQHRFARQIDEAEFQQRIAQWREELLKHHFDKNQPALERMWIEDQYLLAVRDVEGDVEPQQYERKLLTRIILRACREPLASVVDSIKAAIWEEKAEKLEAHLRQPRRAGKAPRALEDKAANAWRNAASAWDAYCDGAQTSPTQQRQRLAAIADQFRAGQAELAVTALEQLHLDLSRAFDARVQQAEALAHLGQAKAAARILEQLRTGLQTLTQDSELKKVMEQLAVETQIPAPLAARLQILGRDWLPRGNLHWLAKSVEAMRQRP